MIILVYLFVLELPSLVHFIIDIVTSYAADCRCARSGRSRWCSRNSPNAGHSRAEQSGQPRSQQTRRAQQTRAQDSVDAAQYGWDSAKTKTAAETVAETAKSTTNIAESPAKSTAVASVAVSAKTTSESITVAKSVTVCVTK